MTGRSDEAIDTANDHLHTKATVLAGIASNVADRRAADGGRGARPVRSAGPCGGEDHSGATTPSDAIETTTPSNAGCVETSRLEKVGRYLGAMGAAAAVLAVSTAPAGARASVWTERPKPNTIAVSGATGSLPALMPRTTSLAAIAATPSGRGLLAVGADGSVTTAGDARFAGSANGMKLAAPIVGIASTPDGKGYWLVARDGGVLTYGNAKFAGSLHGVDINGDVVGLAPTRTGKGYWLAASDGGVFAFGDAKFFGSAAGRSKTAVVGIAARRDGRGYWLANKVGKVFAFGSARKVGSLHGAGIDDVISITADRDGKGYYLARSRGDVVGFRTPVSGVLQTQAAAEAPTVSIAAHAGGVWSARGRVVLPSSGGGSASGSGGNTPSAPGRNAFLACTRAHESDSAGGYRAISPGGTYRGAYQFLPSTWNSVARHAGRPDLIGVDPAAASPADQDAMAWALYQWQGAAPWGGRCA